MEVVKPSSSVLDCLSTVRLFQHLDHQQLKEIVQHSKRLKKKKGYVLCKKGSSFHYFYVVLKGNVTQIVTDSNEFSTPVKIEGKGDYFGEMGILLNEGHSSTVIAITDLDVLCVQRNFFAELVWENHDIIQIILKSMQERLQTSAQMMIALTQMNVESRLAYLLITLYNNRSSEKFCISITQEQLANICGIARQTVSTILNRWKKEGIIELKRGYITVLNASTLTDIFHQTTS